MKPINRVLVFVLDGVGAGEAPDAKEYGDKGSNSLSNTAKAVGGLNIPNLEAMGFGNITPMKGVKAVRPAQGAFGKMTPKSAGKDSITGHWELMGVYLERPFPTYPKGFPKEILETFHQVTGLECIGNKAASGTAIIQELGMEHIQTGKPIVYTSADSVFQIAAHEEIIPIDKLYDICKKSRDFLKDSHAVGRVIARPFIGDSPKTFERTPRRKDYPLKPITATVMDKLIKAGHEVYATGKIDDLFAHQGISFSNHTTNNKDSLDAALEFINVSFRGLLMVNLIEFDMIYGHRNDAKGYAKALEDFDGRLSEIRAAMRHDDIAMIVADHGVDPTTSSTDHSREYIPLIVFGNPVNSDIDLGIRGSFADAGATIAEIFGIQAPPIGSSFLKEIS
ncbi:MAG: phosphopentomutase [Anaerolineaceae bacterium]|nr:phosphopentomutase [Anaerolineaceae bacterium]